MQHNHLTRLASVARKGAALAALLTLPWFVGRDNPACGMSGQVYQKTDRANGLAITFDTRWLDGFGYRPIRITATPIVASKADRTLTVEFSVRDVRRRDFDIRATQYVEIPAGSGPVNAVMSVPQYVPWHSCDIKVFEDGELLKGLAVEGVSLGNYSFNDRRPESLPLILTVDDNASAPPPDTAHLADLLPIEDFERWGQRPPRPSGASGNQLPTAMSQTLVEMPQRWIDYSSLDVVCLSLIQLDRMRQKHPKRFQAILQWTSAGGNLWVYDVGDDLSKLEDIVELSPDDGKPSDCGWQDPSDKASNNRPFFDANRRNHTRSGSGIRESTNGQGIGTLSVDESVDDLQRAARHRPRAKVMLLEPPHFMLHPYGMGTIVALKDADPFSVSDNGNEQEEQKTRWSWLLGELGHDRWLWARRHGISMVRENRDFFNLLIPGVGAAPVTEFCVLITLFVLGIGPVNYWLLRRWGRLHLLVVTIPFSAAVVTLTLFAYAVVADGLNTRVRVRSVTQLDQRRGQAACWSRLSYYAGLAPSRGLTFPEDVAVLPLNRLPKHYYRDPPLRRELIWDGDQRLVSGWLSSRTPMQLLTVRSRPTDMGLKVSRSVADPQKLQVRNLLGTRVQQLVVCSADNKYFWAEGVDADVSVILEPINASVAQNRIRLKLNAQPLDVPPGMDRRYRGNIFGFSGSYFYYRGSNQGDEPRLRTGLLEKTLRDGTNLSLMTPGSYVAIVDRSPEVVLGVSSVGEEASLHVIVGKY